MRQFTEGQGGIMGMGALGSNRGLSIRWEGHKSQRSRKQTGAPGDQGRMGSAWGRAGRRDLLTDVQGTLAQRLRLPVPPALPVEDSQVVEGGSHLQGVGGRSGREGAARSPRSCRGPPLTAGCSGPSVCSLICSASCRRSVASLYLFWSLWGGPGVEGSQPG